MATYRAAIIIIDPTGSPSRAGNVAVYVFDMNQPSLSTPSYSVLVSVYVFMALSTVFHSIISPNNSLLSHFVLPVGMLPYNIFDINQPSWPTPFYSVLVTISVFMALSTVFHSIISPSNFLVFTLFLQSFFCLIGPFS